MTTAEPLKIVIGLASTVASNPQVDGNHVKLDRLVEIAAEPF
jgi:hypothetical protein